MIDVSIIIPVYNAEKDLRRTLNSLLNQTKRNLEFICINDGSTDNSKKILEEYAVIDKRFKIINKKNEGVSIARNCGLLVARGKYIMFLDSDDWYDEIACESAYNLINNYNADVGLFCMNMEYLNHTQYRKILEDDFKFFDKKACVDLQRRIIGLIDDECSEIQKIDYLSVIYLKIYKKSIIDKYKICFEDIKNTGTFEDGLFNIEYFNHISSAVYTPCSYYHYNRYNVSSITSVYKPDLAEKWEYLFLKINAYTKNKNSIFKKALNNRVAYSIIPLGLNIVSGNLTIFNKYIEIKKIVNSKSFNKKFSYKEIKRMPIVFKVFFLNINFGIMPINFMMLYLMDYARRKNRGIRKWKK